MSGQLVRPVDADDHAIGSPEAAVTLVEYGDYECPDCKALQMVLKDAHFALGDHVRIVYRHFPLQKVHPDSWLAAIAAEAAAAQGRFWEYHERLFTKQAELERNDLIAYAIALGLDPIAFTAALDDPAFDAAVRADFQSGVRSDANGTPTLFINGARYDGLLTFDAIIAALESAMP